MPFWIDAGRRFFTAGVLIGGLAASVPAGRFVMGAEGSGAQSLSDSSAGGMSGEEILSELVAHNHSREERLREYAVVRTYVVKNDKERVDAKAVVRMRYQAPGAKRFTVISEEGSGIARSLVFRGLMTSETEAASGRSQMASSISPHNYVFHLLGQDYAGGRRCFVLEAVPRRRDKYLFEGKIWIDALDFAVVKIVARPAKNPSFWIKRVDFVRQYQKIGEFWFPLRDESRSELRVFGKRILTIDHRDYIVNGTGTAERASLPTEARAAARGASLTPKRND